VDADPVLAAQDEDFWNAIAQGFSLDRNFANFNNGGCSPAPRVVIEAMKRAWDYGNQAPSYLMWQQQEPLVESVRRRLARVFGCDQEEIAITRNASESLENVLFGLDLNAGDEVLTTVFDYPRMLTTLDQRERRDHIKVVKVVPPVTPKSTDEIVECFAKGITSRTRLILVSHVTFTHGQINPVRAVVELGKKRGIPVVVDGAHAFVQFPFKHSDLQCEFYGTSLHKWLMAPLGTGFLYISKPKIEKVWSLMASSSEQVSNIRKFEEIGTHPAAIHNAIAEALSYHEMLGLERKAARFRYLRSRWTDRVAENKRVKFFTSLSPHQSCAITTVGIEGIPTAELASWLLSKHNVYVTSIRNEWMDGIRVTPNVYTTLEEIDRFSEAIFIGATKGIS
jgi:selenocysteine lyase/cysteine desulfurase